MKIRQMTGQDLEAVSTIEQAVQLFPWSIHAFSQSLQMQQDCQVAVADEQVAGFIIVSQVLDEAEILNLAVAPPYQRQGVATRLLQSLLHASTGLQRVFLDVRASNQAAQMLYARAGFEQYGVRSGYYRLPQGREDAILMQCNLISANS